MMNKEAFEDKRPSTIKYIILIVTEFICLLWIKELFRLFLYFILNHVRGRRIIKVEKGTTIWPTVLFRNPENIIIGSNSSLNHNNILWAGRKEAKIIIGSNVMFGPNVTILAFTHSIKEGIPQAEEFNESDVIIENNCWIGANATILPGVRIHEGSVIAANAVVIKDTIPFSINAGVPSKFIKTTIP